MAQLINGKAKRVKNEQSIIRLAMLSVPTLKKLTGDTQRKLQRHLTCRTLTSGSNIRLGCGKRDDLFFIVMGKAVGVDAQLDTTTISSLDVGGVFSDHTQLAGAIKATSVTMTTNCVVCSMNAQQYARIVSMHNHVAASALWGFADVMNGFSNWIQSVLLPNPQQRA